MYSIQFGSLGANTEDSMSFLLKGELDVLAAFVSFMVFAPRMSEGTRTNKFVNYAEHILSSNRGNYAGIYGRRSGLSNG